MYGFIQQELNILGIPRHKTYFEAFGVPDDITKVMGWPEEVKSNDKVQIKLIYRKNGREVKEIYEAFCSEPLLNSIEKITQEEILIENGCRSGECALCRTKMISGKVFVPPEVTIRDVDKKYGFIHPCISYPLTNLEIDLTLT